MTDNSMSGEATELKGTTDSRFQPLVDLLSRQLETGYDVGASLAVAVDGEIVTDVWGGWADPERTQPWQADTITNVWSTTKTMTALSALRLMEMGGLDPHEKVSTYWPEFAQNGKESIEVRHLLGHTSGVSGWERPVEAADIMDDDGAVRRLEVQAPWWVPGTASGYHALNQGHLVGEVIRRVDGRGLKQFFAEEIAGPLGADFTIGSPPENHDRIAPVIPPPAPTPQEVPHEVAVKTFTGPMVDARHSWKPEWRAATIGAANGHGNARSVAAVQSVVSNGGTARGVELLSADTIDQLFEVQAEGTDLALAMPVRFGLGYALAYENDPLGITSGRVCWWCGWGGSVVVNDLDNRVTLAYVMNRMQGMVGNETSAGLVAELRRITG